MSDLERRLLAKLLSVEECNRVWDMGLPVEAFEDLTCQAAYCWMMDYWRDNNMRMAPTWVVMEHEFPTLDLRIGDEEVSTGWLVDALKHRYLINQTQRAMLEATAPTKNGISRLDADPEATIGALWRQLHGMVESTSARTARANMAENAAERMSWYDDSEETPVGAPMGFDELDDWTRGVLPGELAACAAYTKVGKSWMLAKAVEKAQRTGFRPILFSLEMTAKEMQKRIDAIASTVSWSRMEARTLMPDDERRIREAHERIAEYGPLYVERPPRGERTVRAMTSRARQLDANYILIDQLSWIDAEREYRGDRALTAKHGDLIFDLKEDISRESAGALPGFVAVQLNRETMRGNNGGRGDLWNFANSSHIEQTVDIAIGLWRNEHMRDSNMMGMDIMGARRAERQSWMCEWRLAERTRLRITEVYTGE